MSIFGFSPVPEHEESSVRDKGIVFWVTGLSGAGKSTLSRLLLDRIRKYNDQTLYFDGDALREIFGNDLGYTLEQRRKSAVRNSRLCHLVSEQGINVICSTISMFDSCRDWNRANIQNYMEIYVKVPHDVLKNRNQKNLYTSAQSVVGIEIPMEEPKSPDFVVENDENVVAIEVFNRLWPSLREKISAIDGAFFDETR